MGVIMLSFYYDEDGRFEDAFILTRNAAGTTRRQLSRGAAPVYRLWMKQLFKQVREKTISLGNASATFYTVVRRV